MLASDFKPPERRPFRAWQRYVSYLPLYLLAVPLSKTFEVTGMWPRLARQRGAIFGAFGDYRARPGDVFACGNSALIHGYLGTWEPIAALPPAAWCNRLHVTPQRVFAVGEGGVTVLDRHSVTCTGPERFCADGWDNDCDGLQDGADPDCAGTDDGGCDPDDPGCGGTTGGGCDPMVDPDCGGGGTTGEEPCDPDVDPSCNATSGPGGDDGCDPDNPMGC